MCRHEDHSLDLGTDLTIGACSCACLQPRHRMGQIGTLLGPGLVHACSPGTELGETGSVMRLMGY